MHPTTSEVLSNLENAIPPDTISTKVVGVMAGELTESFNDPNKQVPYPQRFIEIMRSMNVKSVDLVPEPDNPYDESAIAVYASVPIRKRFGYISNKQRICTECATTLESSSSDVCPNCGGKLIRIGTATQLSLWRKKGVEYVAEIAKYLGGENGLNSGVLLTLKRIQ